MDKIRLALAALASALLLSSCANAGTDAGVEPAESAASSAADTVSESEEAAFYRLPGTGYTFIVDGNKWNIYKGDGSKSTDESSEQSTESAEENAPTVEYRGQYIGAKDIGEASTYFIIQLIDVGDKAEGSNISEIGRSLAEGFYQPEDGNKPVEDGDTKFGGLDAYRFVYTCDLDDDVLLFSNYVVKNGDKLVLFTYCCLKDSFKNIKPEIEAVFGSVEFGESEL